MISTAMYHCFFPDVDSEQTNLARSKPASQSSSHTPATMAGLAVDTSVGSIEAHNSFSCTTFEVHAWWQVDLEATYYIREVVISASGWMGTFHNIIILYDY